MNILITGASGFVGRHLIAEMSEEHTIKALGHLDAVISGTDYTRLDLLDAKKVSAYSFKDIDAVIHLAGLAAVGPSFEQPRHYIDANAGMQINLCEALLKQGVSPLVLVVSSGGVYDPTTLPLTEVSPVLPKNPYAVSKITQELLAEYYGGRGLNLIVARPFNHIGPGQAEGFIAADFAKQVAEIEKGTLKSLQVGDLTSKRDYTDVRDIVRAYALLIQRGTPGQTYNICSGRSYSGQEILDGLSAHAESKITTTRDPERIRPSEISDIYGSYAKLKADTGWVPQISLDQTLSDVLDDWRQRVTAERP